MWHTNPSYFGLHLDVWPSTGSNWLCYRMTTGSSYTHQLQHALCVCIYVIGQAREAKCVRMPASARANETGQDRTSHFLPLPLVKLPIFTPVAVELLCLSPWATSWWHSGQQSQQANSKGMGVVAAGMSEHLKNEAKEKQLIKSATLCLGLFSLVLTRWQTSPVHRGLGWHVYVQLPCYTRVKQNGSNVVDWLAPDGVSDLPSTLIWHDWLQAAM